MLARKGISLWLGIPDPARAIWRSCCKPMGSELVMKEWAGTAFRHGCSPPSRRPSRIRLMGVRGPRLNFVTSSMSFGIPCRSSPQRPTRRSISSVRWDELVNYTTEIGYPDLGAGRSGKPHKLDCDKASGSDVLRAAGSRGRQAITNARRV